jgi:glutathione S-transferase
VPVLIDGGEVIADSTAIALYLEERHPEPALLPREPRSRARVLLLEDWADTALASGCRQALVQAAAADPVLRGALLPDTTPAPLRQLVTALPGAMLSPVTEAVGEVLAPCEARQLRRNLEQIGALVEGGGGYLEGDRLSLADLAVVAQLTLLRFPESAGAPIAGRGVAGLADNPMFASLFSWRDRILAEAGRA